MISSEESVAPGKQISDCTIKEQIAIGGFGTVWRAVHTESGRVVAIKVLHAHLISSENLILRFAREAQAITRMRHPNIVELYDHGRLPDGRPYLVMEYLDGQDLGTHIALHGTLAPERIAAILDQLGAALTAAHGQGIIHRDLKASNVFLSEQDNRLRVVLFDFGIAKLLDSHGPKLTHSSSLLGSPACMSPEQILGQSVDARTDVYALGSLMYQMLVGHPPFSGASQTAILTMHLDEYPPLPSHYGHVAPAFDAVVMKALDKKPQTRFQSVAGLVAAFHAALDGGHSRSNERVGTTAPGLALGLFVAVTTDPAALDDPDDQLLDDLEVVLAEAARVLEPRGFVLAHERGNSALFVLPLPEDAALATGVRRREVNTALSVLELIEQRPTRDDRVTVTIYLHIDEVSIADGRVDSGKLLEISTWVPGSSSEQPQIPTGLVLASSEVLDQLGLKSEPLEGSSSMRIVEDPAAGYAAAKRSSR